MKSIPHSVIRTVALSEGLRRVLKTIDDGCSDLAGGFNLPRECYTDPEFYAFEQEAIFMRSWLCFFLDLVKCADFFLEALMSSSIGKLNSGSLFGSEPWS